MTILSAKAITRLRSSPEKDKTKNFISPSLPHLTLCTGRRRKDSETFGSTVSFACFRTSPVKIRQLEVDQRFPDSCQMLVKDQIPSLIYTEQNFGRRALYGKIVDPNPPDN